MAIVSRKEFVLRGFVILCLSSCVSGSCLSYGHACWGAHGKRSEVNLTPSKGMIIMQEAAAPSNNERTLSRIIDQLSHKFKGESDKLYKINFLSDLINAGLTTDGETTSYQNIKEGTYNGKSKQASQIMAGIVADDREEIPDIPPITINNEYKQPDNKIGIALLRYLAHRPNV
ncbi:uncharacterized protein LOC108625496 [Ceratina calcarata]|uniref:Uncharacterized protein LOC108625496 n=1 Tax=Ceratina calcarata TaxID=156304 RepID=A0AAJ7N7Q6_9HYME|nr:uncharacterized protein LOC108625496 [Ceratina calcarata]